MARGYLIDPERETVEDVEVDLDEARIARMIGAERLDSAEVGRDRLYFDAAGADDAFRLDAFVAPGERDHRVGAALLVGPAGEPPSLSLPQARAGTRFPSTLFAM